MFEILSNYPIYDVLVVISLMLVSLGIFCVHIVDKTFETTEENEQIQAPVNNSQGVSRAKIEKECEQSYIQHHLQSLDANLIANVKGGLNQDNFSFDCLLTVQGVGIVAVKFVQTREKIYCSDRDWGVFREWGIEYNMLNHSKTLIDNMHSLYRLLSHTGQRHWTITPVVVLTHAEAKWSNKGGKHQFLPQTEVIRLDNLKNWLSSLHIESSREFDRVDLMRLRSTLRYFNEEPRALTA